MTEPAERYDHLGRNITGTYPIDWSNDLVPIQIWTAQQAEVERLQAKLPKTKDGVPVEGGRPYFFPCANGALQFWAYLGPQTEQTSPYPWEKAYSTRKAAEAAGKE